MATAWRSSPSPARTRLAYGLNPVMATLLGMLTGIGAGMVRDVLLVQIPVWCAELYAVATLAGAVFGCGLPFIVIWHGWHVPMVRRRHGSSSRHVPHELAHGAT